MGKNDFSFMLLPLDKTVGAFRQLIVIPGIPSSTIFDLGSYPFDIV